MLGGHEPHGLTLKAPRLELEALHLERDGAQVRRLKRRQRVAAWLAHWLTKTSPEIATEALRLIWIFLPTVVVA